ncbi:MAG: hypothetical protein E6296_05320 [Anaerococcus vaginalis]|nr:hypothetical protein [Anaerococcus vaginalis]
MKNRVKISFKRKVFIAFVLSAFAIISITSFYLILSHAFGYYQEGIMGFICDIVFRLFIVILISLVLVVAFYFKEGKKFIIIWWICAILSGIGFFYLLKAPILDFKFLKSPRSLKINYVSFEEDMNYEYSIFYRISGYNDKNEIKIFEIDSKTYDEEKEKRSDYDNVSASIKYLPNTEVLMNLKTYRKR